MTLGNGATYIASSKQKLNTKMSTEAELVAIDNAMAQVLCTSQLHKGCTCQLQRNPRTIIEKS